MKKLLFVLLLLLCLCISVFAQRPPTPKEAVSLFSKTSAQISQYFLSKGFSSYYNQQDGTYYASKSCIVEFSYHDGKLACLTIEQSTNYSDNILRLNEIGFVLVPASNIGDMNCYVSSHFNMACCISSENANLYSMSYCLRNQ